MLEQCALLRYPGFDFGITMGYCQTPFAGLRAITSRARDVIMRGYYPARRGAPISRHSGDRCEIVYSLPAFRVHAEGVIGWSSLQRHSCETARRMNSRADCRLLSDSRDRVSRMP